MTQNENQDEGIKDLKEVFYDNLDDWPTEGLKKTLFKLRPEEGEAEVYLPLNEGSYDITDQCLGIEQKHRPEITIRTRELNTELKRWKIGGGSFFRVIGDADSPVKANKLSIQYLITWTRQLFPFQFTFLSLPFFIGALFLWQFSDMFPATHTNTLFKYLTLLVSGTVLIMLGIWTVFEGMIKRTFMGMKSWKTVPDSMIGFVGPGVLFWTTGLEYAIMEIARSPEFTALIPYSAWLSLLLGVVILGVGADFFIRGEKSFVERFSHPMDYAPLVMFLAKDDNGQWQIEGTQFDYFHYKTSFVPKERLSFREEDEKQEHPWFLVDRSWHAFREYIKPGYLIRFFSNLVVNIIVWTITIGAYTVYVLMRFGVGLPNLETLDFSYNLLILIGVYIFLPMIIVLILWARNRTREYRLAMWDELEDKEPEELMKTHHLSYDRLRILWNLRNREHQGEQQITSLWSKANWIEGDSSRFVARVKYQYPFDRYKGWHTIRDTQEELLSLVSLQTKQEELRELEDEIVEVQDALKRQVIQGIQTIEDELTDFYVEQQDEIEEEKEEIMDKLDALEESVEESIEAKEEEKTAKVDEEDVPETPDVPTEEAKVEEPVEEKTEVEPEESKVDEVVEEKVEEVTEATEEDLGIPDIPTMDEIKEEPETKEKSEFSIPDIPIDVEKEED